MTHVRVALHIIVHLVWSLTDDVHRCTPCCSINSCIWSSSNHIAHSLSRAGLTSSKYLTNLVFIYWFALIIEFQLVLRSPHSEYFEAIYFWNEFCRTLWKQLRELLKENMRETCAKVSTINIKLLLSWYIDILATGAIHFHSRSRQLFWYTYRQDIVSFAKDPWAVAEGAEHILFFHHS